VDFIGAKGDGGGGNWTYKTCKAPVKMSPATKQHPTNNNNNKHTVVSNVSTDNTFYYGLSAVSSQSQCCHVLALCQ